jgi:hypothetical protein
MICSASLIDCTRSCLGIEMQKRHEPAIDLGAGLFPVAAFGGGNELHRFLREGAGQARDPALGAEHQAFERDVVETGEDIEAIAEFIDEVGEAARIRRAFLDRLDVRHVGERCSTSAPILTR